MDKNLFEAALTGNAQLLNALLHEDSLVLDRIPLTCFTETPLHIAALRGHLDFVKILLQKKPILAMSHDSERGTALHLASAQGHVEIVRELLNVMSPDGWRILDQDGRTPLQLAAMNEQLEAIKVLIQTKPEIARDLQDNGESILHTCISYNRFEAMKLLSQFWTEEELASQTDRNGNTLLHLAIVQKQIQTVKYLLQKSSVRATGNVVNGDGFTALDVLDYCPQDLGALQIRSLLMEANFLRAKDITPHSTPFQGSMEWNLNNKPKGWMSRIWNWYLNHDGSWVEKQRGILILAVILVAAVQTEAVMDDLSSFRILNTITIVVSVMIFLMLVSGISLRNKFCLWVLNIATLCIMFVATVTYLQAIAQMSPDSWVNPTTAIMCFAWMLLCLLFAFIHTIFFIIWVIKKVFRTKKTNNDYVVQ